MVQRIRRGDIVLAPLPFVNDPSRSKVRPAVVVQNDVGNRASANLIVLPITTKIPKRDYPIQHRLPAGRAGIEREALITASSIMTVLKDSVVGRIGRLPDDDLQAVDRCLRISLAL